LNTAKSLSRSSAIRLRNFFKINFKVENERSASKIDTGISA
jgi:hypothetical protein